MQEEALVLLGTQVSKTARYICRSQCFASCARTRRHRLRILRVRARAINIPWRHIRVSLVPRPLFRFYVGSRYRDYLHTKYCTVNPTAQCTWVPSTEKIICMLSVFWLKCLQYIYNENALCHIILWGALLSSTKYASKLCQTNTKRTAS